MKRKTYPTDEADRNQFLETSYRVSNAVIADL